MKKSFRTWENASPSSHRMTLRSICGNNCCAGAGHDHKTTHKQNSQNVVSSTHSKTVKKSRIRGGVVTKEVKNNEQEIGADVRIMSTPKELQLMQSGHSRQIEGSKSGSNVKSRITTTSKKTQIIRKSDTSFGKMSKKSSDYSSGYNDSDSEENVKTDYTYAKSLSYRSRVTPNRGIIHPNMSRRSIRSDESTLGLLSDSSSGDESYEKIVKSKNEKNQQSIFCLHGSALTSLRKNNDADVRGDKISSSYYKSNTSFNNFTSTPMKYSYGLDDNYSDNEDFQENKENSLKMVEKSIFKIMRWLWFHMWKSIYLVICYTMLLDTWIIQKFSKLRRWKNLLFLLFLLLLPLLLLGYFNSEDAVSNSARDVIARLSSSFVNFSFWSQNSIGNEHGVMKSFYNALHVQTIGSLLYNWSIPLYALFSFRERNSADYKVETSIPVVRHTVELDSSTTHLTADEIKILIQEVLKQEISGLTLQQQSIVLTEKKEIKENNEILEKLQLELKHILHHSKGVAVDIAEMKNTIGFQENRNEETNGRLNVIENKLEEVERKIHTVEGLLVAMRNCCRNQSDYMAMAEKQIAAMLLEIMNSDHQDKSSPFANFGNWLKSRFVGKEELRNYVDSVADRVATDVSGSLKERAEVVAKAAAAAIVAESVSTMKTSIYNSQEHTILSNDTKTCASEEKVKKIVKEAILLYDADKTGLVDYALESSGGSIFSTRCSETYHTGTAQITVFGIPVWYRTNSPRTVIQPDVHPGQCWAFKGTQGYLVIKLSVPIRPTAFSIEHIPKQLSLTGSIDSAPKDFSVYGLKTEMDLDGKLLGTFTYNKDGDPLQYFYVKDPEPEVYPIVELRILSNHGHMDYTCLYRFRVHGKQQ
ncbi:SUN domain-containing protein 2-like isoform X3 [Centruroides sculpturatus]|uniref:SUN domain-containing protein 2-like isoform X3 n=1 Tax=Centruroides sculpturatus TaxID=218467 RepID=UPI000C6CD56A|nr:SUN domain-containing protein 2-like isoform X3 [Centruroides sculpturatus]